MENTTDLVYNFEQQCSIFKTLLDSSETNDDKKLQILKYLVIKHEFDPNCCRIEDRSLTHFSGYFGKDKILDFLLDYIGVDERDDKGDTVLFHVISSSVIDKDLKFEMTRYLIHSRNADVNLSNYLQMSPLLCAISMGESDIILHLLDFTNVNVNQLDSDGDNALLLLLTDSPCSTFDIVQIMISLIKKHKINVRQKNYQGCNALHLSAQSGYTYAVEYLVTNTNIDLQDQDIDGNNVLFYTVSSRQMDSIATLSLIKFFINRGVDVNASNYDGGTILHASLHLGFIHITKYLLEETNANINVRDFVGNTPLHYMILSENCRLSESQKLQMLKILVNQYGANLTSINDNGESISFHAAASGYLEILHYLIEEKHMDINQQDCEGNSIFMHVIQSDIINQDVKFEIIRYLIEIHKVNVNLPNVNQTTPLLVTFQKELFPIAKYLILHSNADVHHIDKNGDNILDYIMHSEQITSRSKLTLIHYLIEKRNVKVSPIGHSLDFDLWNISEFTFNF
jgi:ankyrin repeat protein